MKKDAAEIRSTVQSLIQDRWFESGCHGYGIASMGLGKSKIIADCINRYVKTYGMPEGKYPITILVNSKYLRDVELPKELKKWGCSHKVKIACYQTACKWKKTAIGLLICDELDYALSESGTYAKAITENSFTHFLGLTGSMVDEKLAQMIGIFQKPPFVVYALKDAHRDGILNPLKIWVHEVALIHEKYDRAPYGEPAKYRWIQGKINGIKDSLDQQYDIKNILYQRRMDYSSVVEEIEKLKNLKKYWEYSPRNPNSRATMMKEALSLTRYAVKLKENILKSNPQAKVILFSQLTHVADQMSPYSYHGDKADEGLITRFNEGEIRELSVVKKVHRGVNFVGLNNAVVHSYSSSLTDANQAYFGRMVRLAQDEIAHVHFLISYYVLDGMKYYCKNAEWLGSVLSDEMFSHIEKTTVNLDL